MIEIYVDTSEYIDLKLYQGDERVNAELNSVKITITDRDTGTALVTQEAVSASGTDSSGKEVYSYLIDLGVTTAPRKLKAVWEFTIGTSEGKKVENIEVVVPYTTPEEIRSANPSLATTPVDELKEMERRVRHIIDNYCNQSFDYVDGKVLNLLASGGDILTLSQRLRNLYYVKRGELYLYNSVDGTELVTFYDDSPFMIVKTDTFNQYVHPFNTDRKRDITRHYRGSHIFDTGAMYEVKGDFGWEYVPNEVNLAATLLVGEYFCSDSSYRRKNIWWAKTEQFELRFNKELLATTGNIDVDLLLMDYVANSMEMF